MFKPSNAATKPECVAPCKEVSDPFASSEQEVRRDGNGAAQLDDGPCEDLYDDNFYAGAD